jgi:hypothetical protein
MKCPHCRKSLWFVQDVCPFCKRSLLPETRAEAPATPALGVTPSPASERVCPGDWATVATSATLIGADAIRANLQAAGIAAIVPDEFSVQAIPTHATACGGIRIQVPSRDYAMARQVLAAIRATSQSSPNRPSDASSAELSLSSPVKCLAFALPLLTCPGFIIFAVMSVAYSKQAGSVKAAQLAKWFLTGVLFWMVAFVLFLKAGSK